MISSHSHYLHRFVASKLLPCLSFCGLASCSIPLGQHNLGLGYHSTNIANNSHQQIVLGVDVQSQPSASTTIGWSETTLLNPSDKTSSQDTPSSFGFQIPFAWRWHDKKGNTKTLGWALTPATAPNPDCHFLHIRRTGISSGYDQAHRGLNFGSISGTTLRANPNLNAAYQLTYQSTTNGTKKLTTLIKKQP